MKKIDIESVIKGIFPTPVYFSNIGRSFTQQELDFVSKCKLDCYKNENNFTSKNVNVLYDPVMESIKGFLDVVITDYFIKVLNPSKDNNITPVITQSWLNFTKESESHHSHAHPNSFISGVFYFDADKQNDSIEFFKNVYESIHIETEKFNSYNSSSMKYPVKTGDLLLFPSSLSHRVNIKKGKNIRTSLAFNVFFIGEVGNKTKLTYLKINSLV